MKHAVNFIDRSGEVYAGWTIVRFVNKTTDRKPRYLCRCICGTEITKVIRTILNGNSKSCGCLNAKNHVIHGKAKTPLYKIWVGMKERCSNQNNPKYKYYGGRGISVCEEWHKSFDEFSKYIGERPTPTHSIDRINNDGNYEPGNVRWATKSEQAVNRRPKSPLPEPPININK